LGKQRLDPKLLGKLAKTLRKDLQYVREQISRRAARSGISSEAALVLWCKQQRIGSTNFLNRLPANVREEVRLGMQSNGAGAVANIPLPPHKIRHGRTGRNKAAFSIKAVVNATLQDQELRERVRDLLAAPRHYDRALREATTVLDYRLKTITGIKGMKPTPLVGKVLNPDPARAVIVVSPEAYEQQGFHNICSGVMLAFRDSTHHRLSNSFTQADAFKFCGLIDILLIVIGKGTVHAERI